MPDEPPLRRHLAVLRRRIWVVVVTTLVALGAAGAVTAVQDDAYRAEMLLVIGQDGGVLQPGFGSVEPFIQTMRALLDSEIVASSVVEELGLDQSPDDLLANVGVRSRPESSALKVTYDGPDQETAVTVLAELAEAYRTIVEERLGPGPTGAGAEAAQITVTVFDPARSVGKVAPRPLRNLGFGSAVGLAAGLVLAFLWEAVAGPESGGREGTTRRRTPG